jgi:hypothetical protein
MKTSFLCKIVVWSGENKARASKTQRGEWSTLGAEEEQKEQK